MKKILIISLLAIVLCVGLVFTPVLSAERNFSIKDLKNTYIIIGRISPDSSGAGIGTGIGLYEGTVNPETGHNVEVGETIQPVEVIVVLNWFEELKDRLPID